MFKTRYLWILCIILLSGCATLRPHFQEPDVKVLSFRLLPASGLPRFEIQLEVMNPNAIDLALRGMSYAASIDGHRIVSGVANNIPTIPAYGAGTIALEGGVDLVGSFQLMAKLLQQRTQGLTYSLDMKLDAGWFMPDLRISKQGDILASQP